MHCRQLLDPQRRSMLRLVRTANFFERACVETEAIENLGGVVFCDPFHLCTLELRLIILASHRVSRRLVQILDGCSRAHGARSTNPRSFG
jgi:hypothetical protein